VVTDDFHLVNIRQGQTRVSKRAQVPAGFRPTCCHLGPSGTLWMGVSQGRVLPFRDGEPARKFESQGLFSSDVLSLLEDKQGTHWAGVSRFGLHRLVPSPVRLFEVKADGPSSSVRSVLELPDQTIVLGMENGGLCRFVNEEIVPHPVEGLADTATVLALELDHQQRLLLGVLGSGLMRVDGKLVEKWNPNQHPGLADVRAMLLNPDGSVWLGTRYHGLLLMEGSRI